MIDPVIRLSLALLIIIGHLGYYGSFVYLYSATVVFMLISGFSTHFYFAHRSRQTFPALVLDRLYVLGLPFLLIALSTLLVSLPVAPAKVSLNLVNLSFNLSFVTINFWRLAPSLYTLLPDGGMLVPQAWYSALLFQWYLAWWWLKDRPRPARILVNLSLLIFVASLATQTSVVNWAYLLLPGTLWLFYSGYRLAHRPNPKLALTSAIFDSLLVIFLGFFLASRQALITPAPEILLGLCLGWFILALLRYHPKRHRHAKFFATLSYYLFLIHFQGIWFLQHLESTRHLPLSPPARILFVLSYSVFASLVLYHLIKLINRQFREKRP